MTKKKEWNTKNNKNLTLEMMSWLLLLNAVEKKTRGIRAIDGFIKKLVIPDSEIPKCPEFEVK